MTSAQVVETSESNNSSFQNYPHPDDHTIRTTDTPGFKPFTKLLAIKTKGMKDQMMISDVSGWYVPGEHGRFHILGSV